MAQRGCTYIGKTVATAGIYHYFHLETSINTYYRDK
jgi:hypothetical protein